MSETLARVFVAIACTRCGTMPETASVVYGNSYVCNCPDDNVHTIPAVTA